MPTTQESRDREHRAANIALLEKLERGGTPLSPTFIEAIPPTPPTEDEWPLTARIIRRLRSRDDIGIGDTIHRQLGAPGRWFESVAESLGINCGCADRRDWLNRRFPYKTT